MSHGRVASSQLKERRNLNMDNTGLVNFIALTDHRLYLLEGGCPAVRDRVV